MSVNILLLVVIFISSVSVAEVDFSENCGDGENYTFSFVGDLIMHSPLQRKAARNKDFKTLWQDVIPYFNLADFSYANLETPLADGIGLNNKITNDPGHRYDRDVYTTYPRFNTHYSLAEDLIDSGIDVVSTANNHSLDRGVVGVDRTVDNLDRIGLNFTGTKKRNELGREWYVITESHNMSVAWISCTESTNGVRDRHHQVLKCYEDAATVKKLIKNLSQIVDVVIVLPHWGQEKKPKPNQQQIKMGRLWLEYGATLVIGSHPHVLQPIEKYTTASGRKGLIMYSLGNFTTFHPDVEQKSTVVLYVNIEKTSNNKVKINGVKYLPLFMRNRTGDLMDVEVYPHLPESNFTGPGFSDLDKSINHVLSTYGRSNAIFEASNQPIDFSHCNQRHL